MDNDAVLRLALVDISESHKATVQKVLRLNQSYTHYKSAIADYRDCMDRTEALYRDTLAAMTKQSTPEPSPEVE